MWLLVKSWQLSLKAILNDCFSLVLLNGKSEGDGHSIGESREAKIRVAFSKNALLIIWFYWPNLCFFGTRISVYGNNHIRKVRDSTGTGTVNANVIDKLSIETADRDGADNPGTDIADVNKVNKVITGIVDANRADNPITNTIDADKVDKTGTSIAIRDGADNPGIGTEDQDRVHNSGIGITDVDKVDKPYTGTVDVDGADKQGIVDVEGVDNPGIGTANAEGAENPSITDANGNNDSRTGRQPGGHGTIRNVIRISFFSLRRDLFIAFSFKL